MKSKKVEHILPKSVKMELTRNQNGGINMLYKYFTEKLLVLQDVDIEKIEEIDNSIHINCRLKRKPHKCPCCGNLTDKIHDYREQPIKDIPAFGKYVFIHIKKKRYRKQNRDRKEKLVLPVSYQNEPFPVIQG